MAQLDAGIYNALMQAPRSALDYAEQFAQLDDRKSQRAMNALKMKGLQQDMEDQQGYRNALSTAPNDQVGRLSYLMGSSNPLAIKHGQEMQKAALDAKKVEADIRDKNASSGKSEWEVKLARTQQHIGQLASVSDVDGAMRWLDEALNSGELPADRVAVAKQNLQSNPGALGQWKQQAMLGGMKVAEQLTFKAPKPTELKLGDRVVMVDMNPNSDTYKQEITSAKIGQSPDNAATQATAMRGQNMTDARAREALKQSDRHFQATQGAGVKMTEDQGKATGWLIQAENAWKNMQAAIDPKTGGGIDAAKPGVNDALAAIPSLGLTTSIANSMRSENRQKFMQGASSLSEAMLRAATGAGVNKDEAAQKVRELTPVFGDDDATIKQKMDAIPLYIESLKVRAGPGASKASAVLNLSGVVPSSARSVVNVKPGGVIRFDAQGNMIQ